MIVIGNAQYYIGFGSHLNRT